MLTVVFATNNGAETLPLTLDSFTKLKEPNNGWKLIAIDNASTDDTLKILQSYTKQLPLQILYQPKRGKNASLNLAIPHFEGNLIIFTDDDIIPTPQWLIAYEILAHSHPECSFFGGRVVPYWSDPPPKEVINSIPLGPAFAIHPSNISDGPVNPNMIWGANMAVRHYIFDAGYRFDETIGPKKGNYIQGSEVALTFRLNKFGFSNWFSNDIIVKHQILSYQYTSKWIWGRAKRFGKSTIVKKLHSSSCKDNIVRVFGLQRWQIWQLFKDLLIFPFSTIQKDSTLYYTLIWRIGSNLENLRADLMYNISLYISRY